MGEIICIKILVGNPQTMILSGDRVGGFSLNSCSLECIRMPIKSKTVQYIQLARGNETLISRDGGISLNFGMLLVYSIRTDTDRVVLLLWNNTLYFMKRSPSAWLRI